MPDCAARDIDMLEINERIRIPDDEFHWSYARSGGPGGQNVNKVASKAVLRWDLAASPSVPEDVKARLRAQQPGRITVEGEMLVTSERFRDQERNRQDCLEKLGAMLLQAAVVPKARKKTKISKGAKRARLADKKRNSARKQERRRPADD
jgi:ribosome-associated protein